MDEVTGDLSRLHDEKLNCLYCSPNIIRLIKSLRMRWAGHVARIGKRRGSFGILVGKPEGSRPPVRRRCRWDNDVKMDFQPIGSWGS
jgi:hypothetical protein